MLSSCHETGCVKAVISNTVLGSGQAQLVLLLG